MSNNFNNEPKEKKRDILTTHVSQGIQRILITVCFSTVAFFFLIKGVDLIKIGARGEWKIVADFKNVPFYITSISPGALLILASTFIMCWGLSILKNL